MHGSLRRRARAVAGREWERLLEARRVDFAKQFADELAAAADAQFVEYRREMLLHGIWRDSESSRAEQIATAITTGVRPDGRVLAPVMPWHSFSHLTREDAMAIALYLKSLPAVKHKSPGPFGPSDKPSSPYMALTMPPS